MNIIKSIIGVSSNLIKKRKDFLYFKRYIKENKKIKIIIWASDTKYKWWCSTNIEFLNIRKEKDFIKHFSSKNINNILTEHVLEHLSLDDIDKWIKNISKYMKKWWKIRIAVPDGNHPSKYYIDYVKPNWFGAWSDDHKVLLNLKDLIQIWESNWFKVELIEYFDDNWVFNKVNYNEEDWFIKRSYNREALRFQNNKEEYNKFIKSIDEKHLEQFANDESLHFTSLIVDFIKK